MNPIPTPASSRTNTPLTNALEAERFSRLDSFQADYEAALDLARQLEIRLAEATEALKHVLDISSTRRGGLCVNDPEYIKYRQFLSRSPESKQPSQ